MIELLDSDAIGGYDIFQDEDQITKFIDVIFAPYFYRRTVLYKNLLNSDFYTKEIETLELNEELVKKDDVEIKKTKI